MFDSSTVVPVAFFLAISYILVGVTRAIADGRTRRRLIEAGANPELARTLVPAPSADPGADTLKWGLMLGALGVGLVVVQFLPFDRDQPIVLGIILIFASAGLLTAYALGRRS